MRIYGATGTAAAATSAPAVKRGASGGFSVPDGEATRSASGPSQLRSVSGIDALIALQGVEDATERRRRALKRGTVALDALDELKIGLLGGNLTQATLNKLTAASAHLSAGSGDSELDSVLGEIELRVEVEIAKMAVR